MDKIGRKNKLEAVDFLEDILEEFGYRKQIVISTDRLMEIYNLLKNDTKEETLFVEWFADNYPEQCIQDEFYLDSVKRLIEQFQSFLRLRPYPH